MKSPTWPPWFSFRNVFQTEEEENDHVSQAGCGGGAKTPLSRKTPLKLFTPSSREDFLTPGSTENSPARTGEFLRFQV